MGRASRRKAQRELSPRGRQDLEEKLAEQYQLLRIQGQAYDDDPSNTVMSLSLATVVRVLVHDTRTSHSLLDQLGLKSGLRCVDTAVPIGALSKMSANPGLVSLEIAPEGRGVRWIAPLSKLPAQRLGRTIPFQPWWDKPIHRDSLGNTWSRRDFVMYLANREGGAHVDPGTREASFEALERENSMQFSIQHSELGHIDAGSPVPASVRQVAFELQTTLEVIIEPLGAG